MKQSNCDAAPLKQTIKEELKQVITSLQQSLASMDSQEDCLLTDLEQVKGNFLTIEMQAATFYLNCYLSPFTEKYPELSICVQNMSR
ncbi:Diadenylate cyclase OS=Lysinibacillus sphaericus OX=1421 GN=dacB PE=3 SV=1 [Lysinibacillus sphaericus]